MVNQQYHIYLVKEGVKRSSDSYPKQRSPELDCDIAYRRAGGQCPRALCKREMGPMDRPIDGPYP